MTNLLFSGLINSSAKPTPVNVNSVIHDNYNDLAPLYITGTGIVTDIVSIGANVSGVSTNGNWPW